MMLIRRSADRGHANFGWLQSQHSFSFGEYYDPRFMGWGNLRVINEDRITPGSGFGTHGHRDMEIISYVLSGKLAHKDSLGNVESIPPGDIQVMSAGTGIQHSEFNHAPTQTHFLQIWIQPRARGIAPGYVQQAFPQQERVGQLQHVVSGTGATGALRMNADAELYAGVLRPQDTVTHALDPKRKAYVHVVRGSLEVNGERLHSGDALMLDQETQLTLRDGQAPVDDSLEGAEVLVFELSA